VAFWQEITPHTVGDLAGIRITLVAMLLVCGEFLVFNHIAPSLARSIVGAVIALTIMVESGFTPAALALLAGAIGAQAGRGAAMGIYSVLLSVGAILGSLIAAALGRKFAVDGLIYGTLAMAVIALLFVQRLDTSAEVAVAERA
jgi:MFS family permease